MMNALGYMKLKLQIAISEFLTDESGEVNIVAIVVLIGIAILLAIVFRDNIKGLLKSLFNTINETATNAIK